jgi:pyruvate dehydrogenase E1 component alpha subunit
MNSGHTPASLVEFEEGIARDFNAGLIRAPVHLYSGNELQMLQVFEKVNAEDWVCCSWRSHYQCLLKGVPSDILRARILGGGSIALCFPSHRIVSSAIVGGILPIAVGLAMGMKRRGETARVHVFLGDMTAESGIYHECAKYAVQHSLNMHFVIEDNGLSVCTPTQLAWGAKLPAMDDGAVEFSRYGYQSKYPHAGAGQRIQF